MAENNNNDNINNNANKNHQPAGSHAKRRTVYGANVIVAIVAAIALVIFFNWIVHREYEHVSPSVKDWVRYDLTSTRRYSLSNQTKKVLTSLDKDYKIVTLFTDKSSYLRRVRDLVDSYSPYSAHLSVEHVNPDLDVVKVQALYKQLLGRFSDDLKPIQSAVIQGQKTMKQLSGQITQMSAPLQQALKNPNFTNDKLKKFTQRVVSLLAQEQSQLQDVDKQVDSLMQRPMPDYGQVKTSIQSLLSQLNSGLLDPASKKFGQSIDDKGVPSAVKNSFLSSADVIKGAQKTINSAVNKLKAVEDNQTYNKLRKDLLSNQSVVVMGPKQVRVIKVSDMYRKPTAQQVRQSGDQAQMFLGEARLTGALISMTLKHPPMVVFVNMGNTPALGQQGQYQAVASRLKAANLDVTQWQASPKKGRFGRPRPPQPAPKPKDGQKAIWIVLPAPPQAMMSMGKRGGQAAKKVATTIKQRMKKGDSVMLMLGANPGSRFSDPSPIVKMLKPWGIKPKLDRVIMRQVQQAGSPPRAIMQMKVDQWPTDISISKALNGLPGMMFETSPIEIDKSKKNKVKYWPLVKLTGNKLWTINNFMSPKSIKDAKYDKSKSKPEYTIGVAAKKDNSKLIVITGPLWAQDRIVKYGRLGPGTASLTGAIFPGNGELFVNSVYWLGGLKKLIATSPQAQEIRRIQPMNDTTLNSYRVFLLAGLPIIVLAIGLGVWTVRRRG